MGSQINDSVLASNSTSLRQRRFADRALSESAVDAHGETLRTARVVTSSAIQALVTLELIASPLHASGFLLGFWLRRLEASNFIGLCGKLLLEASDLHLCVGH